MTAFLQAVAQRFQLNRWGLPNARSDDPVSDRSARGAAVLVAVVAEMSWRPGFLWLCFGASAIWVLSIGSIALATSLFDGFHIERDWIGVVGLSLILPLAVLVLGLISARIARGFNQE
jgi:hypothetical protein